MHFLNLLCTTQGIDNVTTPHYPISALLLSSGPLREVKTKGNFELLALKVVAVAYERWSLTRGFKYSDFPWKRLVFWKTGRSRELVAYEMWSQLEVRLYLPHKWIVLLARADWLARR